MIWSNPGVRAVSDENADQPGRGAHTEVVDVAGGFGLGEEACHL